eukprot:COSAG06_NODE_5543_length_3415_cov_5.172799_2_plen_95_part_00
MQTRNEEPREAGWRGAALHAGSQYRLGQISSSRIGRCEATSQGAGASLRRLPRHCGRRSQQHAARERSLVLQHEHAQGVALARQCSQKPDAGLW